MDRFLVTTGFSNRYYHKLTRFYQENINVLNIIIDLANYYLLFSIEWMSVSLTSLNSGLRVFMTFPPLVFESRIGLPERIGKCFLYS